MILNVKAIFHLLILSLIFCSNIYPQDQKASISGVIYDKSNGEALIGANIVIEGLKIGASSNLSGFFSIPNVPFGKHRITASFIGYKGFSIDRVIDKEEIEQLKIELEPDVVQINQIVVTADSTRIIDKLYSKPVSKIELTSKQINSIPRVIEADLLRSLQTLPGIQPLSDFSSALYIRGGTPDQNLYLIDGTDVYNPEHAFGLFSTFNTSAIKKVELSKGGFGAEYGGRLSSVLNVTNLDGNRNNFQGDVSVSLISGSTTLQIPLGSIGSLSGSFRRTYIDQTYAKFVDEIPDYYFYDGNLKAYIDLGEKDKLVVSFYGGQDKLDFKFDKEADNSLGFKYDWGNVTGSINWRRIFSPKLFGSFWITASRFSSHFNFGDFDFYEKNIISDYAIKGNLEYYFSEDLNIKFGFEEKNLHGLMFEEFPGGRVDADKFRNHYTGYITSGWRPFEDLDIEAGLRYDFFNSEKDYQNLDPRFTAKYRLTETSSLKLSAGLYHQYLNRIPRLFLTSLWTSADAYTKGSSSRHFILGYQKELFTIYEFEIEAYYKRYKDVYTYNQTFLTDVTADSYDENNEPVFSETKGLFNRGDGNSYGIELLLRKDYGALTGWIGYSLSRSNTTIDGINKNKSFIPRQDRTSTVNMVANINLNDFISEIKSGSLSQSSSKWLFSMNFIYSTGQPITLPGSVYSASYFPGWNDNKGNVSLYPTKINSVRLPAYMRMDVSLTWEKNYGSWILAPYIQIFNIGNRKNVWFINYENELKDGKVEQKAEEINMLPILPSIGINIKF